MIFSHLEGEIEGIVKTKANAPAKPPLISDVSSSTLATNFPAPTIPPHASTSPASHPTPMEPPVEKQICKPSQCVIDLIEGCGATSVQPSDPVLFRSIQLSSVITEESNSVLKGEGQAEWMIWTNFIEELLLAAKMSEAEALEPCTLAKAKHHPNWPLWVVF